MQTKSLQEKMMCTALPSRVPCRQINDNPAIRSATDSGKSNEFNITTHHFFISFKAAYDTITRNEIYVIMVELDFFYQTNSSNQSNADNCQVLRQNTERLFGPIWNTVGNVLSTLLFNVVLIAIVRRAKIQTTATIFIFIDIVGRRLEAVRDAYLALEA
jgi:hypothetical protein